MLDDNAAPPPPVFPWPAASASGIGSMPGTDPAQAAAVIVGELPGLPHLAELPARGPGADLIGRTAALLVDLPAETTPRGWKFAARPGRDLRRAAGMLAADLDEAEAATQGYAGAFKIQACGPWTLAATIELGRSQEPALADPGALADLTASLAEGLAAHVAEVHRRIPGATVLVQLDEPALPAVLTGTVPTASGLSRVGAVDAAAARDALAAVLRAPAAFGLVHCCARDVPFRPIKEAGAGAIGFDASLLGPAQQDALAEVAEAGLGLLAGGPQPSSPRLPAPRQTASGVIALWRRMGLPLARLPAQVVITPACGLAGSSPAAARAALAHCRQAARLLPELIEEAR